MGLHGRFILKVPLQDWRTLETAVQGAGKRKRLLSMPATTLLENQHQGGVVTTFKEALGEWQGPSPLSALSLWTESHDERPYSVWPYHVRDYGNEKRQSSRWEFSLTHYSSRKKWPCVCPWDKLEFANTRRLTLWITLLSSKCNFQIWGNWSKSRESR